MTGCFSFVLFNIPPGAEPAVHGSFSLFTLDLMSAYNETVISKYKI